MLKEIKEILSWEENNDHKIGGIQVVVENYERRHQAL